MKKILVLLTLLLTLFVSTFSVQASSNDSIRIWFSQYQEENEAMEIIAQNYKDLTGKNVDVVSRINVFNAPSDLVNNAQLEDAPDLVFMQAADIGGLIESNIIYSLDDYLLTTDITDRYAEVALDAFTYENQIYGIGYAIDTYGLLYNKDLIEEEELPETWSEFYEVAKTLTAYNDTGDVSVYGTLLNSKDIWFNYPIIKSFGGYYYGTYPNGDYNPYDIGFNTQGMVDYVEMMQSLFEYDLVLTNKVHTESEIVSRFANGKVAMMIYGLWYASSFQENNIDYGIASLPDEDDGTTSKALTTIQGFVVNNYSDQKEEAIDFLLYMLSDENQQLLIEAGNGYEEKLGSRNPANLSVMASDYIQTDDILSSLSLLNDECEPFPNIPEGTIWYNYTSSALQTIFFGDCSGSEIEIQEELDELVDKIASDVELINEEAEIIELPEYLWLYLIITIGLVFIAIILVNYYKKKKANIKIKKAKIKTTIIAWSLMVPLLLLLVLFYIIPIIHNFYLSLTNFSGINMIEFGLVGFVNYYTIFVSGLDGLISMLLWTVCFALSVVALSFIFGTLIAVILDKTSIRVSKIYRIIYILPWVIPTIITLLMWRGLLETESGLVNQIFGVFGIGPIPWLEDAFCAKISTILVMTWFSFPYFMVVASGLIKLISKDLYDASKMDGASFLKQFRYITMPIVYRSMRPALVMSFIMQFNQFGVYILTAGGPTADEIGAPGATDLLITYIFNTAFNTKRYAVAAAYAVILFLFIGTLTLSYMKISQKKQEA